MAERKALDIPAADPIEELISLPKLPAAKIKQLTRVSCSS
jgi:hypothetical protein